MSKIKLTLGDELAIMPSAANEKAVKNVLAKRLKLTTPESIQVIYDATVQMHAKTKVPNAPVSGIQNMIDALHLVNPRLAKVGSGSGRYSFMDRLEKSGCFAEAMKKNR